MTSYADHASCIAFLSTQPLRLNGRFLKLARTLVSENYIVKAFEVTPPDALPSAEWTDSEVGAPITLKMPALAKGRITGYFRHRHVRSRVYARLEQEMPDLIIAIDAAALDIAVRSAVPKISLVLDACEIFDGLADDQKGAGAYFAKVLKRSASRIDGVITPSEALKSYYEKNVPHLPKAHIVTNAPNPERPIMATGALRHALGNTTDKILLYHGHFSPQRGLEKLVASADKLPAKTRIVLMGEGRLRQTLEALMRDTNRRASREVVSLLPAIENSVLLDWVAEADYGLIPYEAGPTNHTYCTPNKLYEYPFAGLPVITTNLPIMAKLVQTAAIGVTINEGLDGKTLHEFIINTTEETRIQWIENCEKFAAEHCWQHSREAFLTVIERTLRNAI